MTTGVAAAPIVPSRHSKSIPLVALPMILIVALGCASDAPEPPVPGGQTVDEGGDELRASCVFDENYGPDQPYTHYNCHRDAVDPCWSIGDPTPAGTYECYCDGLRNADTFASSCEAALTSVCGVDLSAPVACGDYQGACYPVRNEPGSWRCECSANTEELVQANYEGCREALVAVCGPPPVAPGNDAGAAEVWLDEPQVNATNPACP